MEDKKKIMIEQKEDKHEVSASQKINYSDTTEVMPLVSDKVKQYFLNNPSFSEDVIYQPSIILNGKVRFYNQSKRVDQQEKIALKLPVRRDMVDIDLSDAEPNEDDSNIYDLKPFEQARFSLLPTFLEKIKDTKLIEDKFKNYLYDTRRVELYNCKEFKLLSNPDEDISDFKSRLLDILREEKDKSIEKLTEKYAKKEEKLEKDYTKLLEKLEKEEADVKAATTQSALSIGSSVLGALLGRTKVGTLSASVTGLNKASRVLKQKKDVDLVKKKIEKLTEDIKELEKELEQNIEDMSEKYDIEKYNIETISIKPKKSDIFGIKVALLWESK